MFLAVRVFHQMLLVLSMLIHIYPHKPLRKIAVASCTHQADSPFHLRSDVRFGDLQTKEDSMVKHDTKHPYWDQLSINNTNLQTLSFIKYTHGLVLWIRPENVWQNIPLNPDKSMFCLPLLPRSLLLSLYLSLSLKIISRDHPTAHVHGTSILGMNPNCRYSWPGTWTWVTKVWDKAAKALFWVNGASYCFTERWSHWWLSD